MNILRTLTALTTTLLVLFIPACNRRITAPVVPATFEVVAIEIEKRGQQSGHTRQVIVDPRVITETLAFCRDRLPEWYVPWDTFPTPEVTARFRNGEGGLVYVLWFGPDWVGGDDAVIDSAHSAIARISRSDLDRLRTLLGV